MLPAKYPRAAFDDGGYAQFWDLCFVAVRACVGGAQLHQSTTLKAAQKAYLALGLLALGSLGVDIALSEASHDLVVFMWANPLMAVLGTSMPDWSNSFWPARWLAPVCSTLYLAAAVWFYRSARHRLERG